MKRNIAIALTLLLCFTFAMAQDEQQITEKDLSSKVFTLKYANIHDADRLVSTLVSRYGHLRSLTNNQIVVRDLPQNLAVIENALAEFDIKPDSIMLTIYMFWADQGEAPGNLGNIPSDIKEAVEEVSNLMPYNHFEAMGNGAIQVSAKSSNGRIKINENAVVEFDSEYNQASKFMVLRNFLINMINTNPHTVFRTDITISDGEITVAGITRPNGTNKAIVSIIKMVVQ